MKKMLRVLLAAGLVLGRITATPAQPLKPGDYPQPVRVACVGDSITVGSGLKRGQDYPARLQQMLGTNWDVHNFGLSSRTLLRHGDHPYVLERAFTNALAFQPDAVIILLGANDTKPQNWKYRDEFASDYASVVNAFHKLANRPRIFVCRPTPVPEPGNYGINETGVQEEIKIIDHLAGTMQLDEIDLHTPLQSQPQFFPDRVHPDAAGALAMARVIYLALTGTAFTGELPPLPPAVWKGYPEEEFMVADHNCRLVQPKIFASGRPWIWRPEFFGAFAQADQALLEKGWALAYMDMNNLFGSPPAMELMDQFYHHLTTKYGLSSRTTLFGFSRGGLYALNWAARRPACVACIYLDAPVCDFKSWPAGFGKGSGSPADWERLKQLYGFRNDQEARAYPLNPIDNLKSIAAAKIPILSVCGDADKTVPHLENTEVLRARYEALGGAIQVILKPDGDHHPHSLTNPQPIVDFVLKYN